MPNIINLPLPQQLTPDTLADATAVMADLNYIANQVNANSATAGTAKVTSTSTLNTYLGNLLVAGSGITLTINNPSGASTITIASNAASVQLKTIQAAAVCL